MIGDKKVLKKLCLRIKKARINADLSQAALVELSGVGLRTIKRVESGEGNFNVLTLIAIARTLNAIDELDALFPETVSPLQMTRNKGRERKRVVKMEVQSASAIKIKGYAPTVVIGKSEDENEKQKDSGWTWGEDK